MLKGISPVISPELLKILMEMGHGDELVIGDGNFPGTSLARNLVRLDGHGVFTRHPAGGAPRLRTLPARRHVRPRYRRVLPTRR